MGSHVLVVCCVVITLVALSGQLVHGRDGLVSFMTNFSEPRDVNSANPSGKYLNRNKRDLSETQKCRAMERNFLSSLTSGKLSSHQFVFDSTTKFNLAMAWASNTDKGVLIVVTSSGLLSMFAASDVWRSTDYGRTWMIINDRIDGSIIRNGNGLQRNPHDVHMVYLVTYHDYIYVTEDGGESFTKQKVVDSNSTINGSLIFHPDKRPHMVMVTGSDRKLYATTNNFNDSREMAENVVLAKWGTKEVNEADSIYVLVGKSPDPVPVSDRIQSYTLVKYSVLGSLQPVTLYRNVISFGIQGSFLYASVYRDDPSRENTDKFIVVSTDGGKTWDETILPVLFGDQFFSVLDMSEELIFMHVDNPGDTGMGTLYTSTKNGVIYSESLRRHLFLNYLYITDFYKVNSMRGVYLTSQLNGGNSIHTVITFNRGGSWKPISLPQKHCADKSKPCQLQIHNAYSFSRGVKARPPLSIENAPGLVLVHGHANSSLQITQPDVYVTTDGGYNWRRTLSGPHYYQIGNSGGLLVAVSTSDPKVQHVKFSTDQGACWHDYQFTNSSIKFMGLFTEPGGKSMTVSIWGFTTNAERKWVVYVINFADVITRTCDQTDYTRWTPHSKIGKTNKKGEAGCLLGVRESFLKVKSESWCRNGYDYDFGKQTHICTCTREDYECDYGFYHPSGSDNCIKDPNFSGKEIDICSRGHEEEIVTEGYRKIPGDKCENGVQFEGRKTDLTVECSETHMTTTTTPTPTTGGYYRFRSNKEGQSGIHK